MAEQKQEEENAVRCVITKGPGGPADKNQGEKRVSSSLESFLSDIYSLTRYSPQNVYSLKNGKCLLYTHNLMTIIQRFADLTVI